MSIYYYLVCDRHKEYNDGCSRSAGGLGPLADGPETLHNFIFRHQKCALRVVDEYDDNLFGAYENASDRPENTPGWREDREKWLYEFTEERQP